MGQEYVVEGECVYVSFARSRNRSENLYVGEGVCVRAYACVDV